MFQRVPLVTLHEKCQRCERCTLNYIKNVARECMLGSPYVLQVPTHPNSRCRVLKVTNPSNLREEGVTASLPHLMALGLMSPRGAPCQAYTGSLFQDSIHPTLLTALHPSEMPSKQARVVSRVRANSTMTALWWRRIPALGLSKSCCSLQSELGSKLATSGVVLALQLLPELQL